MIAILIPWRLQLTILQLEGYEVTRFFSWIFHHFWTRSLEGKKRLLLNQKARLIMGLALCIWLGCSLILVITLQWIGLALSLLLVSQPYIFLAVGTLITWPIQALATYRIKKAARSILRSMPDLKVIGISGSYGKTSTKVLLYELLRQEFQVLKTPSSYNTLLGISRVINLELYPGYDFFICEMGAHHRGDIQEIAGLVTPSCAIITGLNEQHLERFGSLENAVLAEFESIASLPKDALAFINIDNELIKNHYHRYNCHFITYGLQDHDHTVRSIRITLKGTHFTLVLDGKEYPAFTNLIGTVHLLNVLAASTVAYHLGVPVKKILQAITTLQPAAHRLEIKPMPSLGITLMDNAFSSNTTGFRESIGLLKEFPGTKILVTPGIVELGDQTIPVHQELGALAEKTCDYIVLIGESDRTRGLAMGIKNADKVIKLPSISALWPLLQELRLKNGVVLLENDLPDNY